MTTSTEQKTKIIPKWVVLTSVTDVSEHVQAEHVSGFGADAKFKNVSHGWFITFEGSHEKLFFGSERPPFEKGDRVRITFQKEKSA